MGVGVDGGGGCRRTLGRAGVREWALDPGSDRWLWGPGGWESPRWLWAGLAAGKALQIPCRPQAGNLGAEGQLAIPVVHPPPDPSPTPRARRRQAQHCSLYVFVLPSLHACAHAGLHVHALPVCVCDPGCGCLCPYVHTSPAHSCPAHCRVSLHVHIRALTCW